MTAVMQPELTPAEIIAQAEAEITAAEELAVELENKVRDGDDTVTYDQVEKARGLKRFAQLRREAAEKKAAKLAADTAAAEYDAFLTKHLAAVAGRDERVEALLAEARKLIDQALDVAQDADSHVYALAKRAASEGNPYHPEPETLVGFSQFPELAWFEYKGIRMNVLMTGGVMKRLLAPYKSRITGGSLYADLKSAI